MLVQKFFQKNHIKFADYNDPNTRETEIRIRALVISEYEEFIRDQTFTQKKLAVFETGLKAKLDEVIKETPNVKRVEVTKPISSFRDAGCNITMNPSRDQYQLKTVRGQTSLNLRNESNKLKSNISLPQINKSMHFKNTSEMKFKNSNLSKGYRKPNGSMASVKNGAANHARQNSINNRANQYGLSHVRSQANIAAP